MIYFNFLCCSSGRLIVINNNIHISVNGQHSHTSFQILLSATDALLLKLTNTAFLSWHNPIHLNQRTIFLAFTQYSLHPLYSQSHVIVEWLLLHPFPSAEKIYFFIALPRFDKTLSLMCWCLYFMRASPKLGCIPADSIASMNRKALPSSPIIFAFSVTPKVGFNKTCCSVYFTAVHNLHIVQK